MIETKLLTISPVNHASAIAESVDVLRRGGLVAFPTETVYGLGADAFNREAVAKVFAAKGRPADNPLIVHIGGVEQLQEMARSVPANARKLADAFWPGPLTLVVEHRGQLPENVTAGLPTVAVRVPDHFVTLSLIKAFGRGLVGPSANISGKPSPTTAQHVYNDLQGRVDMILDAGPTTIGVESTVVDVTSGTPTILRLGGLARSEIEKIVGPLQATTLGEKLKRSPGTRYRHYAPAASLLLFPEGDQNAFNRLLKLSRETGKTIGCIVHSIDAAEISPELARRLHKDDYSRALFDLLRSFDEIGVDAILVESISETGLGEAVMDRLRKAAERE
ncbi:MAG TPA: L-threonylcarbamoyladenylate synthase [Bacteroidota bacterium]|jgi:L-threonylcarbamoyladenylate synthase|nr:L-threonylcarbamoyladenylate synthase [Bacteroidota bacterium]